MNKGTPENLLNKTMEQVKQEILEMVDNGVNYREIAKIPFKIEGAVRRFNISQISRWKKEKDEGVEGDEGRAASKAFQLFEDGKGPVQAVVEMKMLPEEAEEYYRKWLKMKELDLSAPIVPKRIKELENDVNYLFDTQSMSIINPDAGCGNPSCSAESKNELEVEVVCKVCGKRGMVPVNWEDKE